MQGKIDKLNHFEGLEYLQRVAPKPIGNARLDLERLGHAILSVLLCFVLFCFVLFCFVFFTPPLVSFQIPSISVL